MGAHHYNLEVVPRRFIEQFSNPIPLEIINKGIQPWLDEKPDETFLEALRVLLPVDNSWTDVEEYASAIDWGSEIRIWKENDIVRNIEFRYSGIDDWELMNSFLDKVKYFGYVLANPESGHVVEPNEKQIRRNFTDSIESKRATKENIESDYFDAEGCPDLMDLVINPSDSAIIEIRQLKNLRSGEERKMAVYNGVSIGMLVEADEYYKDLNIELNGKIVISLWPAVPYLPKIKLPTLNKFLITLRQIILEKETNWVLVCEADCDREPVHKFRSGSHEANEQFENLVNYCKAGSAKYECPTFLIESSK
jgi:hypothetical protein